MAFFRHGLSNIMDTQQNDRHFGHYIVYIMGDTLDDFDLTSVQENHNNKPLEITPSNRIFRRILSCLSLKSMMIR